METAFLVLLSNIGTFLKENIQMSKKFQKRLTGYYKSDGFYNICSSDLGNY